MLSRTEVMIAAAMIVGFPAARPGSGGAVQLAAGDRP
jgi:hypothetical protein